MADDVTLLTNKDEKAQTYCVICSFDNCLYNCNLCDVFLIRNEMRNHRKGIIYLKNTIIDVWQGPNYASELKESFTTKDISNWRPFIPL